MSNDKGIKDTEDVERNKTIFRRALVGELFKEIGADYGIGRERTRVIFTTVTSRIVSYCESEGIAIPKGRGIYQMREDVMFWIGYIDKI